MKKSKLIPLTSIRFFAALHVICFHNVGYFDGAPDFIYTFLRHGYVGVSLFFVLSGFILAYNYIDVDNSKHKIENKSFWLARFIKIYPIYFVSVVLSLPLFFYFLIKTIPVFTALIKGTVISIFTFTLLQSWVTLTLGSLNAPGWSLSVEAFLYFTFPFIAPYLAKFKTNKLIGMGMVFWLLTILSVIMFDDLQKYKLITNPILPEYITSPFPLWQTFLSSFPLFHLPQFMLGIITAILYLRKNQNNNIKKSQYFNSSILEIGVILCLFIILSTNLLEGDFLNNGGIAPIFCILFYVLADGKGVISKLLSLPVLVTLGDASYCMYIFQAPVRSWLQIIVQKITGYDNIFPVYLIILMMFSLLFWHIDNQLRPTIKKQLTKFIYKN